MKTDPRQMQAPGLPGPGQVRMARPDDWQPDSLCGLRVLIVEDDYFVASDLARTLTSADAIVVGPAVTVGEGASLLDEGGIDFAVLDICLQQDVVYRLADRLVAAKVPFLFYSADFFTLPDRFKHIRQIGKHQGSGVLSASLALGAAREKAGLGLSESDLLQTNEQILRALRQMARLLVRDNDAADDLVEATLRRAIAEAISMAPEDRPSWLADLMERVWIAQRG
jgi:DNA-binding NarL/FixJ family response regulator